MLPHLLIFTPLPQALQIDVLIQEGRVMGLQEGEIVVESPTDYALALWDIDEAVPFSKFYHIFGNWSAIIW